MILEGKKISKIANNKKILENIEISISSEKIYGLLGPNGAGKTSLFSILSGLTRASSGEIFFNSKKINQLSFENRSDLGIIYLPQEPSVFRELTVEDNIKAALEAKKYDAKGKFGRILGDFKCNGRTLSKVMIEMHHAVEYHGQSKEDIREAHLANRRKVKI